MKTYNDLMPDSTRYRTKKAYFAAMEDWKSINSGLTSEVYDEILEWLDANVVSEEYSYRYLNNVPMSAHLLSALDVALASHFMDLIPYNPNGIIAGTVDKTSGRNFVLGMAIAGQFPNAFTKQPEDDHNSLIVSPTAIANNWLINKATANKS